MNVKLVRFFDRIVLSVFCFIIGMITKILPKKIRTERILVVKIMGAWGFYYFTADDSWNKKKHA